MRTADERAAVISTLDTWFGTADFYLGNVVGRAADERAAVISTLDKWFGTADFYLGNAVGDQPRGEQLQLYLP